MFSDIAERIRSGGVALSILAMDLGITMDQLRERLAMMEHMGYLRRLKPCTPLDTSALCNSCPGCFQGADDVICYCLTDKGWKLIRSEAV